MNASQCAINRRPVFLASLATAAAIIHAVPAAAETAEAAPQALQSAMIAEDTLPASSVPPAAVQPAAAPEAAKAPVAPDAAVPATAAIQSQPGAMVSPEAPAKSDKAAGLPLATQDVSNLPTLEVRGRRKAPGKAVDATALKINASLRETPRSLTVMNAERIREQNFTTANSTFHYTPGVFANSYGQGGYHFYSRGQRMAAADNRVDGFAGIAGGGDYSPGLFGIEQTVMLRGPASLLYGASGAPGGVINLITKKPREIRSTQLDLRMGPYGGSSVGFNDGSSYTAEVDATGPLTDDGRVLFRAQGNYENQRHFTADVMDRNRHLNLALTYRLDPEGRYQLTPMVQTTRHNRPAGRGTVISPATVLSNATGQDGINFDDLSPLDVNTSAGGRVDETFLAGADFRARPNDAVQVNAAYRYFTYDTDMNQYVPNASTLRQEDANDSKSWTVQRRHTHTLTERFNHGFDINSSYDHRPADTDFWKTLAQVGFNARITGTDRSATTGPGPNQSAINIYTGAVSSPLVESTNPLVENPNNISYQWNVYAQNQTALFKDMLVLTLGLGYMQEHLDRDYSRTNTPAPANLGDVLATRYGRPTPNAALLYNLNKDLGLYASYSTNYALPAGDLEDRNGETGNFDPEEGVNYEVGAKYDIPSMAASFTGAWFWTEMKNELIQTTGNDRNSRGNNYYFQVDGHGRRGTGVEFSAEIAPLRNLRLSGGGAYIDVVNHSVNDEIADGGRGDKVPEWSFNAFSRYDIGGGTLQGLGASLGFIYQGDRLAALKTESRPVPLVMPWFTRVDAGLYYRVNNNLDFALNVENLANDERIVYGGTTGAAIELGSPRRATFRTSYRM
jgi:outer membrane receptor protein involved in Fe transport